MGNRLSFTEMKLPLVAFACMTYAFISAQTFDLVPHFNAFDGVGEGQLSTEDFNGDSHPDILVTGPTPRLYFNNGQGRFMEAKPIPIAPLKTGAMAIGDLNQDGALDVIVTGVNKQKKYRSYLYHGDDPDPV